MTLHGQKSRNPINPDESTAFGWKSLYKIAGLAALAAVLVAMADIILTFLPTGAGVPGTLTAVDWFKLLQDNCFFGLRNLGLLPNIPTQFLMIPIFLAFYAAHQRDNKAYAALAMIFAFVGTAIYLSNNAALPMLDLSEKYAAATTEAEKSLLAAAGEAVLARGEDFAPGALLGFVFGPMAGLIISFVMLRSKVFSKLAAWAGIAGFSLLAIFTVCATFVPAIFDRVMILAMLGGLLVILWYILVARGFFRISKAKSLG